MRRLLGLVAAVVLIAAFAGVADARKPVPQASLGNPRTGYLAANVSLFGTGFMDGPTIQINTGTWLVSGGVVTSNSTVCKLTDGTTTIASGYTNNGYTTTFTGFVTETASVNLRIACLADPVADGSAFVADEGAGPTANWVTAYKTP